MTGQRFWNWWAPHSAALPGLGREPGPLSPTAPSAVTVPTAIGCPGCRASVSLQQRAGWRAPQSLRPSPHCRGPQGVPDPRPACFRLRCGLGEEGTCFGSPRLSRPQCQCSCTGQGRGAPRSPRPSLRLPGSSRRPLAPCPPLLHHGRGTGWEEQEGEEEDDEGICHCHCPPLGVCPAPSVSHSTGQGLEGTAHPPPLAAAVGEAQGAPSPSSRSYSWYSGQQLPRAGPPRAPSRGPPAVLGASPAVPSSPDPRVQPGMGPEQLRGGMGPEEPLPPAPGICGPGARGSHQAPGAMTAMTVTAAAAHAQAGLRVSSDEPEPAGSRSAGGGGCGTAGGDTARAQRGHGTQPWARHRACAHARYTH